MSKNHCQVATSGIRSPDPNDILSGRGRGIMKHEGNMYYRDIVNKYRKDYVVSDFHRKKDICKMILDLVRSQSPPGRFLKQNTKTKLWHEISHKEATVKTTRILNYGAPGISKELLPEAPVVTLNTYFGGDYEQNEPEVDHVASMESYPTANKTTSPSTSDNKVVEKETRKKTNVAQSVEKETRKKTNVAHVGENETEKKLNAALALKNEKKAIENEIEKKSSEEQADYGDALSSCSKVILANFSSNQSLPTVSTGIFSEAVSKAEKSAKLESMYQMPFFDDNSTLPSCRTFHTSSIFSGPETVMSSSDREDIVKSSMEIKVCHRCDHDASKKRKLETAKMSNCSVTFPDTTESGASPSFDNALKSSKGYVQEDLQEYFENYLLIPIKRRASHFMFCDEFPFLSDNVSEQMQMPAHEKVQPIHQFLQNQNG